MSNVRPVNFRRPEPQVTDVDPTVEQLASLLQRSGLTDQQVATLVSAARHTRMEPSTVRKLRELAVRRPQNYTLDWIAFAIGYAAIAWLLRYVAHHTLYLFVLYRVALGSLVLCLLLTGVINPT